MAVTWNATETEVVEPYRVARNALDGVGLRLMPADDFDCREVWYPDSEEDWCSAEPELSITVEPGEVTEVTGVPEKDVAVAVTIRDRDLNRFVLIHRWPLDAVPDEPIALREHLTGLSNGISTDICVFLVTIDEADRGPDIAGQWGEILSRKTFRIRRKTNLSTFPKVWKKPDEFEEQGLHADTIFWVEWLVEDLNRPPREAFLVWLNERYKEQLQSFEVGPASGHLLATELAASVLAEISAAVMTSDQDPDEPTGTIKIVADTLEETSGMSLMEMRKYMERHDGFSRIRAWAQQRTGVTDALRVLSFAGERA